MRPDDHKFDTGLDVTPVTTAQLTLAMASPQAHSRWQSGRLRKPTFSERAITKMTASPL